MLHVVTSVRTMVVLFFLYFPRKEENTIKHIMLELKVSSLVFKWNKQKWPAVNSVGELWSCRHVKLWKHSFITSCGYKRVLRSRSMLEICCVDISDWLHSQHSCLYMMNKCAIRGQHLLTKGRFTHKPPSDICFDLWTCVSKQGLHFIHGSYCWTCFCLMLKTNVTNDWHSWCKYVRWHFLINFG